MNYRQYIIPILTILFLLVGMLIEYTSVFAPSVERYLDDIEIDIHTKEADIYALKKYSSQLKRIVFNNYNSQSVQYADLNWLESVSNQGYTFHIYQGDSLVFWSNNHVNFDKSAHPLTKESSSFEELFDGFYELIQYELDFQTPQPFHLIGFIPIKYKYKLDSKYLQPQFVANPYIPNVLSLHSEATSDSFLPIKTAKGQPLCYLNTEPGMMDIRTTYLKFFAFLFGFIGLGIIVNKTSRYLVGRYSLFVGSSFLVLVLMVLRILSGTTDFSQRFAGISLFDKAPEVFVFGNSLGDFLINIILLFWVILFIHRQCQIPYYGHLNFWKRFGLVFLNAFGVVFAIANVAAILRQLIFYSNITFNFDNVFNLERNSLFAIVGVILLLICLFLICHLLLMIIMKNNLRMRDRFLAYGLAILTFFPLSYYYSLNLISVKIFLFLIVFIILFDIFIEHETNNLTWLVTWLVILAGFSSGLLYSYNQERDAANRLNYSQSLIDAKDTLAERKILDLEKKLLQNKTIQSFQFNKGDVTNKELYKELDKHYSNIGYLFNNYKYHSQFLDQDHFNLKTGQALSIDTQDLFAVVEETPNNSKLYLSNEPAGDSYYLKIPYYPGGEVSSTPHWWMLRFFHKQRKLSRVYTELLKEQSIKNLDGLEYYDYAIYKDKALVSSSSNQFSNPMGYDYQVMSKEGTLVDTVAVGTLSSVFTKGNKAVVLKRSIGGYVKPISLFSFIFALLIFFVLAMSVVNNYTHFFPKTLSFSVIRRPSLRGKIQLYVISLIVTSFILIGVVTIVYFSNSYEEYHENRLVRKTESIIRDTEHELSLLIENMLDKSTFSNDDLDPVDLEAISNIHRMDINLYDLSGHLAKSSEMDIFNKGIVSRQMNALAYQRLARMESNTPIQDVERIGTLDYKSAYIPLQTYLNDKLTTLGYLGLPYYSKQSKLREDVTVFMGALLNVYVFLLIIAGAIAIIVANSITKPIAVIGEKLKEFKLGGRNEPLEWHSHDELGTLIEEYNRMVLKIKEGADLLAQSEREGAWREMAKQVAHEIKNPLTPMKLSIQYLQHAYRSNPDDIEPLLKRVSNTLIEQIDNLSQIASEFSSFAKMPRAENQRIILNNLVRSVYDLFKEHRDKGLQLDLPEEEYYVYADKNHLIRVFNNLIKNAIQAIPDEREGHILVKMYTEKGKIVVEVKDNGTGISDEMKEKVFVPNFTTKNSGTGLGLAISKNIIESVSGEIYFKTKVGKGTSFYVRLPIIDVKHPEEVLT